MIKLFISYRSSNSNQVDTIISRLRSVKDDDGNKRYQVWQDKDCIPEGQDWWEAILNAIEDCDVFIFMVSRESVQSENCLAELRFARNLNCPILPFVIEGEFSYNSRSGKHDIPYWDAIPIELDNETGIRNQFLFHEGSAFINKIQRAIDLFLAEPERWRRFPAERPADPRGIEPTYADDIYVEACDYAGRLEFQTAKEKFQILVNRKDPDFGDDAYAWVIILNAYQRLVRFASRASTCHKVKEHWTAYERHFPKPFIRGGRGVFDPKRLKEQFIVGREPEPPLEPELKTLRELEPLPDPTLPSETEPELLLKPTREAVPPKPKPIPPKRKRIVRQRSVDLMPKPFAWIDIPAGQVTLKEGGYLEEDTAFDVMAFSIAKYPVANAQYAKFIEAGGYNESKWWTAAGWQKREEESWQKPRYWDDSQFNDRNQPVVGVSWYEAVAFCLWLSDVTGEKIMLPMEQQWQRAAQGDDGRIYPWGDEWDGSKCKCQHEEMVGFYEDEPSVVTAYEGKGDSPFGVVDMAGNVWEWCLTDFDSGENDINTVADSRVHRGNSWRSGFIHFFRCRIRSSKHPDRSTYYWGFRISRS